MTTVIRSISQVGTTEPFELQISRGQIPGHEKQFKFGFNSDVDDSLETVWAEGGLYAYLSSASVLKVSSSSANDTSAGTGARTVQLFGLDADYNEINETITLSGQTAVDTTNSFLRINRMVVRSAGSGGTNAGVIYAGTGTVTAGVPANKYATVAVGDGQTLMALWTVPAGYTAYLFAFFSTVATEQNNKFATTTLVARPEGEVFQVKDKFTVENGAHTQEYKIPVSFAEKTDLEVRCIGSSSGANIAVSGGLDIVYVKNSGHL